MLNLTDYQITAEIYNSAKRIVYRGIRLPDRRPVILKCFGTAYPTFTEIVRLQHEYRITKNLNISGIVKPLALLNDTYNPILVFEDIDGLSLKKYLNHQPIELDKFLKIAIQLAQALEELHQHGIIHKDIKPSNIIINPDTLRAKLTDFAIASQLVKEHPPISHPNLLEGSLAYMSPEQTGRMNRSIDYRTDFYSLGVTFYEMLTSQLPFYPDDSMELVHCHIARTPIPPNQINPRISSIVSDLIIKLLGKTAEERYQTGFGLKIDLEKFLEQWQEKREISEFTFLATHDFSGQLQIPEKLYGRETEVRQLLETFDRVAAGSTEMMLVSGYSGIGKTSLINEIHKPIVRGARFANVQQCGYFISGKFDQFKRNIPYSALIQAFSGLMRQLLTESQEKIAIWKSNLLEALGQNGQIIIDVIPELEWIIEKQPEVLQLRPTESQNRFIGIFQKFINVFAQKQHPIVLFLDDLQWADLASLKLIELIITDATSKYLLLIGAYRDNEVSPTHATIQGIEKICQGGAIVNNIVLQPLEFENVRDLVKDTLGKTDTYSTLNISENFVLERIKPLAELLFNKTQGNPFFLTTLLSTLYSEKMVAFDFTKGSWAWDLEQIQALGITDYNVVELVARNIKKLSATTQQVLKLAACIGNTFNLNNLAIVNEKSLLTTANELWEALQGGLILSLSSDYKTPLFIDKLENQYLQHQDLGISYKFLHDRVQQAAYSLIPEAERKITHLKIGQLLLQKTDKLNRAENIFDIVNQLNIGVEFITKETEKEELAKLNLMAGKKALAATAYDAASRYLNTGLQLLPVNSWETKYELTRDIYIETAAAEYITTNFERAKELSDAVLERAKTLLEKIPVYKTRIQFYIAQNQMQVAINIALSVLESLGVRLPKRPTPLHILLGLTRTKLLLSRKRIKHLANLPDMTDLYKLAAMEILMSITSPVFMANPVMFPLIIFTMLNLGFRYGNCSFSALAYVIYGLLLCGGLGDIESGYQFGQLALQNIEKYDNKKLKPIVYVTFNSGIRHWKEPAIKSIQPFVETIPVGLEVGDIEYACHNARYYCSYPFLTGENLESLAQKQAKYLKMLLNFQQEIQINYTQIWSQIVLNLLGLCTDKCRLAGEIFNEDEKLPVFLENNNTVCLFHFYFLKANLLYIFNEYSQSLEQAKLAEKYIEGGFGSLPLTTHNFYYSLALLALYSSVSNIEKKRYLKKIASLQKKLRKWAVHAPANNKHKYELVEAEKARVFGQELRAIEYYDRAIKGAKEQGYVQEEALANELAAEFYLSRGREKIAQIYLTEAYYSYMRWGARAKVKDLEEKNPFLITRQLSLNSTENETIADATISRSNRYGQLLDINAVFKASQIIASKIDLDNLLTKLMKIVLENGGAQSGILLLNQEGQLFIESIAIIEPNQILVRQSIPIKESDRLPFSIVNYVARTQEDVVLTNASDRTNFINDPYIIANQTKSVLCTPILSQGKLMGILYLENNLIAGAFTPERSQLLKLLCSQAAISLENAQLYEAQKEYTKTLERQVRERTQELQQQKALFDAFFDASSAGFVILDRELRYVQVNEAIVEFNGVPAAEHIGRTIWEVVPHIAPMVAPTYQQILTTGEPLLNVEVSGKTPSQPGVERHWLTSYFPLPGLDRKPIGVGIVVMEISDRKRTEEALQRAKEAADAASRAKGDFLSKMSHELRTPLNAILGFSQLLNRDSSLTSQQQEYLGIINRAGEHLLSLINDVLEMSKIEAGRIELRENTFNLYCLLNSLKEMFQFRAESKSLKIIFNQTLELPEYVQTDESKLRQVLINLLGNAIKFTEYGYITLKVRSEQLSSNTFLIFEIEDTGPGIAPEEIDTLFEAFVQTKTGRKAESGTGLGLPISRQFVQLMGGDITVSSRLDKGTIFKFDIQVKLAEAIEVPKTVGTRKVIGLKPNQSHYRILVVEDKFESRLLLVSLLSEVGFEVRDAVNGQVAVTLTESWQPHLIWMDMQMPVMNGYEATRTIRAREIEMQNNGEYLPSVTNPIIIALTANAFAEDKAAVLSAGCNDFVSKPFREEVIFDKIAQHLEVRYIYEQLTLPKTEQPQENKLDVELFQGVPPHWIDQLYQATIELDDERIRYLNEQIKESHPLLAVNLENFTNKLRFDAIIEIIKRIKSS